MGARILIVEDEAFVAEVLCRHLKGHGYEPRSAGSAEEALALLDREPMDAVLLDNILPGMTGLKALPEIRRRSNAPAFLMTGHMDGDFRKDALLLGAAGLLAKPLDLSRLDALLEKALAARL